MLPHSDTAMPRYFHFQRPRHRGSWFSFFDVRPLQRSIVRLAAFGMMLFCLFSSSTPVLAGEPAPAGNASNALNGVKTRVVNGQEELLLNFTGMAVAPQGFNLPGPPPQLVLNLSNVRNQTGLTHITTDQLENADRILGINLVESGGTTRLTVQLRESAVITGTRQEGNNTLVVVLGTAKASSTPLRNDTRNPNATNMINQIDFQRGSQGEGRLLVDMAVVSTVDIRQEGAFLVVTFPGTSLPESLERRLDVTDFDTPVQAVDSYTQRNDIKIAIDTRGRYEYSAYQTDTRLVVEFRRPKPTNRTQELIKPIYKGERLTLNFQDIEVRRILQVISDFTDKNVVVADSVHGSLTLRLRDVPWDQALDIILQSKNLEKRENGSVLTIAPRGELFKQDQQIREEIQKIEDIEPVVAQTYQINYLKAVDLRQVMTEGNQPVLSKRGAILAEPTQNVLFVQDTPTQLAKIEAFIRRLDVPSRQVLIEARIVSATEDFSRNLGSRLLIGSQNGQFGSIRTNQLAGFGFPAPSKPFFPMPTPEVSNNINLIPNPYTGGERSSFGLSVFDPVTGFLLGLELTALDATSNNKIISSPRVVARDQQRALITQGKKLVLPLVDANGNTTYSTLDIPLSLSVTPRITPDNQILLELDIKKDSLENVNGQAVNSQQVTTSIIVNNGDTAMLGGVYEITDHQEQTKVPLLGDIPGLGFLFRSTVASKSRTELLIFITPRILPEKTLAER